MASIAPLSKSQPFLENTQFTGLKRPQAPIFSVPIGRNQQSSKLSLRKSKMVVASSTTAAERPKKRYPGEAKGFVEEMRFVAMKLHTRDQAKEGEKEPEGQPMAKWEPSVEGYLKFLVDSKFVYDTLEKIVEKAPFPEFLVERRPVKGQVQHQVARVLLGRGLKGQVQQPAFRKCDGIRKQSCAFATSYSFWRSDAEFRNTGLERSERLAKDLEWFTQQGHAIPEPSEPGLNYARILEELSQNDPQAFLCHFYNIYFAHSAGGRMIGRKVAEKILNKKELEFYKWDGDLSQLLQNVREKLNKVADSWTREQKDHCLEETEKSFKLSGDILRLILSS